MTRGWSLVSRSTVNKLLSPFANSKVVQNNLTLRQCGESQQSNAKGCRHFSYCHQAPYLFRSSLKMVGNNSLLCYDKIHRWDACAGEFFETNLDKGRIRWIFWVQMVLFQAKRFYLAPFCKCIDIAFRCMKKKTRKAWSSFAFHTQRPYR